MIVRVMAAGVNFNNVWAALGEPIGVWRYGDHPRWGHHIGGSDASGVVWKVGPGVTRWKPGDEVVIHCNQASSEDPEVHGSTRSQPRVSRSGVTRRPGDRSPSSARSRPSSSSPSPPTWRGRRQPPTASAYFTAYRMLMDRCQLQAGHRVLIWGAAGGLGVFATQLCALSGADAVGVVSSEEKGQLIEQLGAVGYINRSEFARDDAPRRRDGRGGASALQGIEALLQGGRGDLGRTARHRVRARRQGHVPHLGAGG